jgi:L-fuconolactonase
VFSAFGVDRLMYGSDWPVSLLAAEYSECVNIIEKYMSNYSDEDKRKVFGENAARFYGLK